MATGETKVSIFQRFIASFDNTKNGFSARKLSAFAAVSIAIYISVHYVTEGTVISALERWLLFAVLCLGIITAEQIIKYKSGGKSADNNQEGTAD